MEWIEVQPLPEACVGCKEEECYNCDAAGFRWVLSAKDELLLRRKAVCKAMERLLQELADIDRELELMDGSAAR